MAHLGSGPVPGRHAPVLEAAGHTVELGGGGLDGGSQVLLALVLLGPDGAQAVVGHHLSEQFLGSMAVPPP